MRDIQAGQKEIERKWDKDIYMCQKGQLIRGLGKRRETRCQETERISGINPIIAG
jgi:hypothetical protein